MDQSHRHDALGQTTSPVISSMRAASAVSSVFPSVPRNVLILQKFRPLSTRTAACTAAAAWKPAQNRSSKRGIPMNQSEKRQFLIHELLKEAPEFQGLSVPSDSEGQKQLLRGLMNIRPPRKCSREFLEIQDSYLTAETAAKGITDFSELTPLKEALYLWQGDITTLRCDAIVNAANSGMTGCP